MRIVALEAQNVKRLKAVEVTLEDGLVVIAGRNGQGKSSLIDSIAYAFGGKAAQKLTTRPIRDGETDASVKVTLSDPGLIVTRTWKAGGADTLVVANADGSATFNQPQTMLDKLVGSLSFDPLAFVGLEPKKQLATFLELVDLGDFDPDENKAQHDAVYAERTVAGRDLKALQGQLAGLTAPAEDDPTEEVSTSEILTEQQDHEVAVTAYRRLGTLARDAEENLALSQANVARLTRELEQATAAADSDQVAHASSLAALDEATEPVAVDFHARLAEVEATNTRVRANQLYVATAEKVLAATAGVAKLTEAIADLDKAKETALAGATMPIEGLGMDENGVTFGGIPFTQCSSVEQLRVSTAIGMALNPNLTVMTIKDGSLLDDENLQMFREMAGDKGFQILMERVGDEANASVVIEDGMVKS